MGWVATSAYVKAGGYPSPSQPAPWLCRLPCSSWNLSQRNKKNHLYSNIPVIPFGKEGKIPTFAIQYILSMSAKVYNIFDSCNDSCEESTFQSDEYDYMGNVICSTYANSGESEYQRVAKRDYGLTSSAAKEISMVENNETLKKDTNVFYKKNARSRNATRLIYRELHTKHYLIERLRKFGDITVP